MTAPFTGARWRFLLGASVVALATTATLNGAQAQSAAAGAEDGVSEVVVTGFRQSLQNSLIQKRQEDSIIDVISAEDVGKFPESNLAEALQRLPGISIERENGEGRTITVRGLGGDFVRTRLNGIETVAASGNNEGQSSINRTRGFDYNVFASDLFSSLKVRKSAEASVDEGSLGATVDIDTGRPLDYRGRKITASVQDTYYANDKKHNPRYALMLSDTWFDNTLGFLVSGAYQKRDTTLSFYDRNPGQFEVYYRGSDLAGPVRNGTGSSVAPVCQPTTARPVVDATNNRHPANCYWGFALPTQTTTTLAPSGIGRQALGIDANSLMFGSNPAAWAIMDADLTRIMPSLTTIQHQTLGTERKGYTSTLQWKPREGTKVTVNALRAEFSSDNQSHIVGPFGLNRQFDNARAEIGLTNTTTGLRPYVAGSNNYFADRRGVYGNVCNLTTANCGGSSAVFSTVEAWNGTSYVPVASTLNGNTWSTNPYNLDPYDYYNNPGSVGYNAALAAVDRRGIQRYDQLVGKPHTTIQDVHINDAGQVDYLKLDRVDWLLGNAFSEDETTFSQYDMTIDHEFTPNFRGQFVYGRSYSNLDRFGGRVDAYALDKNGFVFDERGGGDMPIWNPGFDVSDPAQVGEFEKGYAGISVWKRASDNDYETLRADFNYAVNDDVSIDFGLSKRIYEFDTQSSTFGRGVIPTVAELNKYGRDKNKLEYANLTMANLGSVHQFGAGLDLAAGVPTALWSPDRDTFKRLLGFDCNCVNDFGDWRLVATLGDGQYVREDDTSFYGQLNFSAELFGRTLRGNGGIRYANTKIESTSSGTTGAVNGQSLTGGNEYHDFLPSVNFNYELTDTFLIRFAAAKTMARPSLGNLTPGVTSLSTPVGPDGSSVIPSLTVGNPKLEPFRSDNLDLNIEWYFQKDALLSISLFHKDLSSYPRQQRFAAQLDDFLPPELYASVRSSIVTAAYPEYMDSGLNIWNVTSFVDSPGGIVRGFELQYQQGFTFLPQPFDGLGIVANLTHIDSSLSYITQAGVAAVAPWPFASPNAVNVTVYYEKGPLEARVSYSWRDRFATRFPGAEGICPPGLTTDPNGGVCGSPYNDFGGTEPTQYVDTKVAYRFSPNLSADFSIQNLLNEPESQYNYTDPVVRKYSSGAGRIISAGLRFTY